MTQTTMTTRPITDRNMATYTAALSDRPTLDAVPPAHHQHALMSCSLWGRSDIKHKENFGAGTELANLSRASPRTDSQSGLVEPANPVVTWKVAVAGDYSARWTWQTWWTQHWTDVTVGCGVGERITIWTQRNTISVYFLEGFHWHTTRKITSTIATMQRYTNNVLSCLSHTM